MPEALLTVETFLIRKRNLRALVDFLQRLDERFRAAFNIAEFSPLVPTRAGDDDRRIALDFIFLRELVVLLLRRFRQLSSAWEIHLHEHEMFGSVILPFLLAKHFL